MLLRPATAEDLDFILKLEADPGNAQFIGAWPRAQHLAAMAEDDIRYLIGMLQDQPAGFAILRGLTTEDRSIHIQRLVIATPGKGKGRGFVHALVAHAFAEFDADLVWLHVFQSNTRAHHVYRSLGFVARGSSPMVRRDGVGDIRVRMEIDAADYAPG